ncbi:MAG: phosphoribosylaminoimidazolecarboxamide formyltransferase [Clostridia bacterium]|nr:phosphoribosylaminoimidazolecarboxamide formyltransferase [Clostridia bacterium]
MYQLELKYGCNPNQKPARIFAKAGTLPLQVLSGKPGYINFLDALNGWQLVRELRQATGLPAAASFKHVSPAGAAVGLPLPDTLRRSCFIQDEPLSVLACAYARARGADRMSSFGDWICLSDPCDASTARLITREVSDGVIAPGYDLDALEMLKRKRGGFYNIVQIDASYTPEALEQKEVFGITFEQERNTLEIDDALFMNIVSAKKALPPDAKRDLKIAMITLKYTQSNSVCFVKNGQAIGIGAGQQSRIHCTRLAGDKADNWWLRQHEKTLNLPFLETLKRPDRDNAIDRYISGESGDVLADGAWQTRFTHQPEALSGDEKRAWLGQLTDVTLGSDAFFPFRDNIDRAARSGVRYVAEPGGSIRDDAVIAACDQYGMTLGFTGLRLFHH